MHRLTFVALLIAISPWANAQKSAPAGPHFAPLHSGSPSPAFASRPGFGHHHQPFYPPVFFADPFYSDVLYNEGYPVASQPPVIVMQAPAAPSAVPESALSPAQPLVIELQGDRYVRVSGEEPSGAEMIDQKPSRGLERPSTQVVVPHELPPVVLVFRDSHREEVSDYVITDGVLYARADYYTGGAWNKKIELTSLDLPGTFNLNRSRGVRFQLPSAPNEVITRP